MPFSANSDRGQLLQMVRQELRGEDIQRISDSSLLKTLFHLLQLSKSSEWLTSALEFLRQNKFDFNKWLDQAIPYWRLSDIVPSSETAPSEVSRFIHAPLSVQSEKNERIVREKTKLLDQVMEWQKQQNPKPIELDIPNYAIRLALYRQVRQIFGNLVFYTFSRSDSKVQIKVNRKELQKQLESQKKAEQAKSAESPHQSPSQKSEESTAAGEEVKEVKEEKKQEDYAGFTRVVEHIIKRGVPIVIHNGFYDLCLLYQHFINELPEEFVQFSASLRQLFKAGIYDTKHMQQHFNWIRANNLEALYMQLRHNPITKTQLQINHGEHYSRYDDLNQAHQAGYDAFMTGCCFLRLAKSHEINLKFQEEKSKTGEKEESKKKEAVNHEASKAMENTPIASDKINHFKNKVNLNTALKTYYFLEEVAQQPGEPNNSNLLFVEVAPDSPNNLFEEMLRELGDYTVKRTSQSQLLLEFYVTHKSMESVIECIKDTKGVSKVQSYNEVKKFSFERKIS